jgi:hypothetical protein
MISAKEICHATLCVYLCPLKFRIDWVDCFVHILIPRGSILAR